jgi:hypothetical protein
LAIHKPLHPQATHAVDHQYEQDTDQRDVSATSDHYGHDEADKSERRQHWSRPGPKQQLPAHVVDEELSRPIRATYDG